jgi:hypothetical protein
MSEQQLQILAGKAQDLLKQLIAIPSFSKEEEQTAAVSKPSWHQMVFLQNVS